MGGGVATDDAMRTFQRRALEAEERLTRLESLVAGKQEEPNTSSQNFSSIIRDLKTELQAAQNELKSEKDKASEEIQKLAAENAKLQYRIKHLVRAVKEADAASNQGA